MKLVGVTFVTKKIADSFEDLNKGKYEEKELYSFIERAIQDMKKDPQCGIRLPSKLWPKEYVQKYAITNLWKYDLPNGWRLIYTITQTKVMILNVILEWFDHKDYEKRFKY